MSGKSEQVAPKKNGKRSAAKRKYDNSGRSRKSDLSQKAIIESLVALLVERRGGDVSIEEVARKSGLSVRTVFRFFKDKETLHRAMDSYLMSYVQSGVATMNELDFISFAKSTYDLFDRHESLTMAYLYSPFGHEARTLLRKRLNEAMIGKILQEKKIAPPLTRDQERRLALIVSLVSAKVWHDVRSDFGFTGAEMADPMAWALTTLLEKL